MATIKEHLEERIVKTENVLKEELNTVRAGRANPALLDKVMVEYYGTPTPLKNLSNISTPDPRTLLVAPFDAKSISNIEKAINMANIGINPSNDGKVIRLVIPQVTEVVCAAQQKSQVYPARLKQFPRFFPCRILPEVLQPVGLSKIFSYQALPKGFSL